MKEQYQFPGSIQTGGEGIESSLAEKDLGIVVDERLDTSQQHLLAGQKAKHVQSSVASRSREVKLHLLWLFLLCIHLECWVQPSTWEGHGSVEASPEYVHWRWLEGWSSSPMKTSWELWGCSVWGREGETLEQPTRNLERDFLKTECSGRTRGNGFKLKDGRFRV